MPILQDRIARLGGRGPHRGVVIAPGLVNYEVAHSLCYLNLQNTVWVLYIITVISLPAEFEDHEFIFTYP